MRDDIQEGFIQNLKKIQPSGSEISLIFIGPSAHRGSIIYVFVAGCEMYPRIGSDWDFDKNTLRQKTMLF